MFEHQSYKTPFPLGSAKIWLLGSWNKQRAIPQHRNHTSLFL
jgi:hypothetical protein